MNKFLRDGFRAVFYEIILAPKSNDAMSNRNLSDIAPNYEE